MTIAIVLGILVLFDAGLAGFRAAAGRDGRIAKGAYFRIAVARSFGGAVALLLLNAGLVALLVLTAPDPDASWLAMQRAGEISIWIFGSFATLVLAAFAFWFSPWNEWQLLSTIIVLGPLTLARPLVIAGGLAIAAATAGEPRVWIAAVVAAVTMLAFERLIGRGHAERWRTLV